MTFKMDDSEKAIWIAVFASSFNTFLDHCGDTVVGATKKAMERGKEAITQLRIIDENQKANK